MVAGLEAIRSIANDMPYAKPEVLGGLAVNMSEKYRGVAMDARQAITMLTNPDLSHRLKLSVQVRQWRGSVDQIRDFCRKKFKKLNLKDSRSLPFCKNYK